MARLGADVAGKRRAGGEQARALSARHLRQPVQRGLAGAASRRADGPAERRVVERVHHEAQVGDDVLDLAPLVEAHAPHDQVRDARPPERVLQHPGLGVGPVEDGDVAVLHALATKGADGLRHECRLLVLVPRPVDRRPLALPVVGPEPLVLPGGVVGDDGGGDVEDALGRPVVLLEGDDAAVRVVLLEVEDVPEVGAAPAVHRLVGIADHAEVAPLVGQELDDAVLRAVGVLVLVDEDVGPERAVPGERLRRRLEEVHDAQEQVVEVHGPGRPEALLVQAIERRHPLLAGRPGEPLHFRRGEHLVLGVADPVHRARRGEGPLVEIQLAHHLLHHAEAVLLVVAHQGRRLSRRRRALAQDAHAGRVEGRDERRADACREDQVLHAPPHLLGRLVREGHRQEVPRVHALDADQVRDAMGDDARLPAAGPGHDEHGPRRRRHGVALGRVQEAEDAFGGYVRARHGTLTIPQPSPRSAAPGPCHDALELGDQVVPVQGAFDAPERQACPLEIELRPLRLHDRDCIIEILRSPGQRLRVVGRAPTPP